jgi:hypothetical protein
MDEWMYRHQLELSDQLHAQAFLHPRKEFLVPLEKDVVLRLAN